VDVHLGHVGLDRLHHLAVEVPGEFGVDPALQSHLGGAPVPRLPGQADDLVEPHQVGLSTQIERLGSFRESTEPALEIAQVGVVDVPVDDIGDGVTDGALPEQVGGMSHGIYLVAPGPKQLLHLAHGRRDSLE
jgi:hypothetical protein